MNQNVFIIGYAVKNILVSAFIICPHIINIIYPPIIDTASIDLPLYLCNNTKDNHRIPNYLPYPYYLPEDSVVYKASREIMPYTSSPYISQNNYTTQLSFIIFCYLVICVFFGL